MDRTLAVAMVERMGHGSRWIKRRPFDDLGNVCLLGAFNECHPDVKKLAMVPTKENVRKIRDIQNRELLPLAELIAERYPSGYVALLEATLQLQDKPGVGPASVITAFNDCFDTTWAMVEEMLGSIG